MFVTHLLLELFMSRTCGTRGQVEVFGEHELIFLVVPKSLAGGTPHGLWKADVLAIAEQLPSEVGLCSTYRFVMHFNYWQHSMRLFPCSKMLKWSFKTLHGIYIYIYI